MHRLLKWVGFASGLSFLGLGILGVVGGIMVLRAPPFETSSHSLDEDAEAIGVVVLIMGALGILAGLALLLFWWWLDPLTLWAGSFFISQAELPRS